MGDLTNCGSKTWRLRPSPIDYDNLLILTSRLIIYGLGSWQFCNFTLRNRERGFVDCGKSARWASDAHGRYGSMGSITGISASKS